MTLTAIQQLAIKEKIIGWIEQHFSSDPESWVADQTVRKKKAVDLINAELATWCEANGLPVQTLNSLCKETPDALPTAGRDRNGGRCDILVAWLNFESNPGSSLDCLPPVPDTVAPQSPREIVLRETYAFLKENPLPEPQLNRSCKRIIKQAIDNQDLTIDQAFDLKMIGDCREDIRQQTRIALIMIGNHCDDFRRLCIFDTLLSRLNRKLETLQPSPSNPEPPPSSLVHALSFIHHWRRTPQSRCETVLASCFGDLDTVQAKEDTCELQP